MIYNTRLSLFDLSIHIIHHLQGSDHSTVYTKAVGPGPPAMVSQAYIYNMPSFLLSVIIPQACSFFFNYAIYSKL